MASSQEHKLPPRLHDASADIIKLALLAVGGQGGGVLSSWITELAHAANYDAQMTSVAGVAQRTGATVYYIEMAPKTDTPPVFALNPSINDIDIVLAAELMEAGRAVLRGFVSPDKTTLITSTHRILATTEKIAPGDGRADSDLVMQRLHNASLSCLCYDMESIAKEAGSVISASLFGALAASKALPFPVSLFEQAIKSSSRGVDSSLNAFRASIAMAEKQMGKSPATSTATESKEIDAPKVDTRGPAVELQRWQLLLEQVTHFPTVTRGLITAGMQKTFDYQDADYAHEYLDRLSQFAALDSETLDYRLTLTAAKYLANAMCYDDILRVADLKTRPSRAQRLRQEQQVLADQIVQTTEYFHPRAEELVTTLPTKLGDWVMARPRVFKMIDVLVNRGRRIRSDGIVGFTLLWLVAGLLPRRRGLLRHKLEMQRLEVWQSQALSLCRRENQLSKKRNYEMAVEYLRCQRLIKGYSDTHARGLSKFEQITTLSQRLQDRDDGPEWINKLRKAALADAGTEPLEKAIASFNNAATVR